MEKIEQLRQGWNEFRLSNSVDSGYWAGLDKFMKTFPIDRLASIGLDEYTDSEKENAFIYNLEFGCGKSYGGIRGSTSYKYGVFKKDKGRYGYGHNSITEDKDVAKKFYVDEVQKKLALIASHDQNVDIKPLGPMVARKIAYIYYPAQILPIYSEAIIKPIIEDFDIPSTRKSYLITQDILNYFKEADFFQEPITRDAVKLFGDFLYSIYSAGIRLHKNMIFYGAPGTGKTHAVMESIKAANIFNADECVEFIQLHPSYGYEDFIEGLKPEIAEDGKSVKLTLKSGHFKSICRRAMASLTDSANSKTAVKNYYFVADEINRAELSRVFGEALVCLEESKRIDYERDEKDSSKFKYENGRPILSMSSLLIKTQYAYLNDEEQAVYIKGGHQYFGVPSNLFFIGTMNDIDRSIDAFDLALRRRFHWKRMDCRYDVIEDILADDQNAEQLESYIEACKRLNKLISDDWGLGSSYEIGHGYFLEIGSKKLTKTDRKNLFDFKIKPLLTEYLRSEYSGKDLDHKLDQAKNIFFDVGDRAS